MAEKNMQSGETQVILRKKQFDDVTVVKYGYAEDGSLMVSEEVSGPSSDVAYGEPMHQLRAIYSPVAIGELATLLGEGDLGANVGAALGMYFKDGKHALVDLMDLCDARRVSYAYQSLGSATGVTYRPSSERL